MHSELIAQHYASIGFCCSHDTMMQTCFPADAEADSAALVLAKAGRRLWLHADINSSPGGDSARHTASSRPWLTTSACGVQSAKAVTFLGAH